MDELTLPRAEWAAVARELDAISHDVAPPGLRDRIAELLSQVPASWSEEACTLVIAPSAATIVRAIVRRGRGLSVHPDRERNRTAGLAESAQIIRDYQNQGGGPRYRIEHRSKGQVWVLGFTTATNARQADLSDHASRLVAAGASGELVLIDESTGEDVARRYLKSTSDDDSDAQLKD